MQNLMPFIHIWLLKSRKQNPAKWGLTKIAKLSTREIKYPIRHYKIIVNHYATLLPF